MYKVVLATVADDLSGIHLRLIDEKSGGETHIAFLPKDQCGKIPEDKDQRKELELLAEVLKDKKVNLIK
jgi:hypothetical protein